MTAERRYEILPLGDSALIIQFGNTIDIEINRHVLKIFYRLKMLSIPGIIDITPAYSSIAIYYNVEAMRPSSSNTAFDNVSELITRFMHEPAGGLPEPHKFRIPVCYALTFAPDLSDMASEKKIDIEEIIHLHCSKQYIVYMIGFLPGFAYMGEIDERIAMPRKIQPRQSVAAGSVGIAGRQTGVYPLVSPGGWQIIGRTPLKLFDLKLKDPVLLKHGDEIEFYPISEDEFKNY